MYLNISFVPYYFYNSINSIIDREVETMKIAEKKTVPREDVITPVSKIVTAQEARDAFDVDEDAVLNF